MVYSEWVDVSPLLEPDSRDVDRELSSDGWVYNLEVERNHNYVADGILVSNCGQDDFHLEAWEAIQRRLSLSQGRVLGATTLYNFGWLKTLVYDRWIRGDKNFNIIQFKSTMNPKFPREEYERMKESLPSWKFAMMYDGEFSRPAGMIFGDFNETKCFVPRDSIEMRQNDLIVIGIDPGAVNTAMVYGAVQKDYQRVIIWGESLEGNMTTAQHAVGLKSKIGSYLTVRVVGGAKSEKQFRMDMGRERVKVYEPAVSDVEAGLDRIVSLMKQDKLIITHNCPLLINQIREYSRKVDAFGQPTEDIQDKEKYHLADALRYLCTMVNLQKPTVAKKEPPSEEVPGFKEDPRLMRVWNDDDRVPGLF